MTSEPRANVLLEMAIAVDPNVTNPKGPILFAVPDKCREDARRAGISRKSGLPRLPQGPEEARRDDGRLWLSAQQ